MALTEDSEAQFIELISHVYASVRWSRMSTSKNPWDIFNHRLRAAACRANLPEFVSRLCNSFGLQSLPLEAVALVQQLRPCESELLELAYREHIVVAMQAVMRAKQRKANDDRKDDAPRRAQRQ